MQCKRTIMFCCTKYDISMCQQRTHSTVFIESNCEQNVETRLGSTCSVVQRICDGFNFSINVYTNMLLTRIEGKLICIVFSRVKPFAYPCLARCGTMRRGPQTPKRSVLSPKPMLLFTAWLMYLVKTSPYIVSRPFPQ